MSRLRVQNESLRAVVASQKTTLPANQSSPTDAGTPVAPDVPTTPRPGDAPSYLFGEIVTRKCLRIPVERFGTTEEETNLVGCYG